MTDLPEASAAVPSGIQLAPRGVEQATVLPGGGHGHILGNRTNELEKHRKWNANKFMVYGAKGKRTIPFDNFVCYQIPVFTVVLEKLNFLYIDMLNSSSVVPISL